MDGKAKKPRLIFVLAGAPSCLVTGIRSNPIWVLTRRVFTLVYWGFTALSWREAQGFFPRSLLGMQPIAPASLGEA